MLKVYAMLTVLVSLTHYSEQLSCHSCKGPGARGDLFNSFDIPYIPSTDCGTLDSTTWQNCPGGSCSKYELKIQNATYVLRTCAPANDLSCQRIQQGGTAKGLNFQSSLECFDCNDRDGCNSAQTIVNSLLTVAVATLLARFIF